MIPQYPDEDRIFNIARKIYDVDCRADYLDHMCGDNCEMRSRIETLLGAHEDADFMTCEPAEVAVTTNQPIAEGPGTVIGRYKLLQQVGEGGFGVVFMAEQQSPLRRTVAFKIIKPGMDSRDVVARFEAERQALAMMNHPNIAQVFDGGVTESGRPYFVMELVKGVPITDYSDKNDLPTEERLQLFLDVCLAVQHAHQKGVIHRDLKPTNIMVTLHDGRPVPKVIDFGVSKAINQRLTEKTLFTHYGQMVGTPQYMSPEQAEMSGLDVDTRTDVYSLGVLLYELLTGTTPVEAERLRDAGYAEIQRIIQDEEPPKPSVRLSTAGEKLTVIAKHRRLDPPQLRRLIRGELDWIVMKALEKERNRRFESPLSLATDVRRYLQHEAVEACPPSNLYRLAKFIRRRKAVALTVAIVLLSLVSTAVGTSVAFWRADSARRIANREKERAESERKHASQQRDRADRERERAQSLAQERLEQQYISDMNAAMAAWNENNPGRCEELLKRYSANADARHLRKWEWFYLWRLGEQYRQARESLIELPDCGADLVFDATGDSLFVAHSYDALVTRWNVSGTQQMQFGVSGRGTFASSYVSISADGRNLAHRSPDFRAVALTDILSGEERTVISDEGLIARAVYSPTSPNLLATMRKDGAIEIWDVQSDVSTRKHLIDGSYISFAFSPDSKLLGTGTSDGRLCVWDIQSRTQRSEHTFDGKVSYLAFSPDGNSVAVVRDEDIYILNLNDSQVTDLGGHDKEIYCLAFSPDGHLLATGGYDRAIRLWDVRKGTLEGILKGNLGSISGIAFSPDGSMLASSSLDRTVLFWDLTRKTYKRSANVLDLPNERIAIALLPGDEAFAAISYGFAKGQPPRTVSEEESVRFWDLHSLNEVLQPISTQTVPNSLAVSMTRLIAVGGSDGSVRLSDLETQVIRGDFPLHSEAVTALAVSQDGELFASGSRKGDVAVWHNDGEVVWRGTGKHAASIESMVFDMDKKLLVSAGEDGKAIVWNVLSGKVERALDIGYGCGVLDVAISPDGGTLGISSQFLGVKLWELADLGQPPTHLYAPALSLLFSSDGTTMFSGCNDGLIQVWDVTTRQIRCTLSLSEVCPVCDLAMTADCTTLVAASWDKTVQILRTAPKNERKPLGVKHSVQSAPRGTAVAMPIWSR